MATLRGNRLIILIGLALIATFLLIATDSTFAQEKHKISWTAKAEHTKYTFQHSFEIPDISGHVLRLFELRSTWPDGGAPTIQGEKVVEAISRATSDRVAGNGLVRGYTIWRFENGDQVFQEYSNTVQTVANPDQSAKTTFVGTYVMTGGTGKLKGIKGVGQVLGARRVEPRGESGADRVFSGGRILVEK